MTVIPLKINGKQLCEIFEPAAVVGMTDDEKFAYSIRNLMYPTAVDLTSETYSRNAERTADYELDSLLLVNRKAKPEFTWDYLKFTYAQKLLAYLGYTYNFKNSEGVIVPVQAADILVTYLDFTGERTITAYLGQTIDGTLTVMDEQLWWNNFRIAFPER